MNTISILIAVGFLLVIYFLPTIIAVTRKHKQVNPIIIINLFGGFTYVGYVIALAWAVSNDVNEDDPYKDYDSKGEQR